MIYCKDCKYFYIVDGYEFAKCELSKFKEPLYIFKFDNLKECDKYRRRDGKI